MTNFPDDASQNSIHDNAATVYPVSPVPSDAHLEASELPFTAFGQFGANSLDIRVFEQDVYWVNTHGEPFRLDEMSHEYRLNVINFLFNDAEHMYVSMLKKYAIEIIGEVQKSETGTLPLDHPLMVAATSLNEKNPVEWLNSTPLVKRLSELLGW
jgi:hypothetical protein